jgi:hypothetical protein
MIDFTPTTPEEVYSLCLAQDWLEGRIDSVVKHLYGFLTNTPVDSFTCYMTNTDEVYIWADCELVQNGMLSFPARFLFQDDDTNRKEWQQMEEERKAKEKAEQIERDKERLAKEEADERAEYERLKAKYGDNNA